MSKKSNVAEQVVITDDSSEVSSLPTTSAKIRFLLAKGWTRGKIVKEGGITTKQGLPIRYQHVRNVEITPIKTQKA